MLLAVAFWSCLALPASAAPAPGRQTFNALSLRTMDLQADGDTLGLTVTCDQGSCGLEWDWVAVRTDVDPTSYSYDGSFHLPPQPPPASESRMLASEETSTVLRWYDWTTSGTGRYVFVVAERPGERYIVTSWDLQAQPEPTPEPTTPPSTTTPPPTTTAPSTTTAPPSTTEPTSPPPTSGGLTCTEAAPCFVHQVNPSPVDVGSIEVAALTEEQWSTLELALAVLVMFTVGGFVASWRHGRAA